jgi:hypothetical protein
MRSSTYKEERFILDHSFRCFNPWSPGLKLGSVVRENIIMVNGGWSKTLYLRALGSREGYVYVCVERETEKDRERERREREMGPTSEYSLQGTSPVTYFPSTRPTFPKFPSPPNTDIR